MPEAALETPAAVFRTMPHYPLFDEPSAAAPCGDHEGWALHLPTGDRLRVEFAGMAAQLQNTLASQRATLDQQVSELRERLQAAEQAKVEYEIRARELGGTLAELRQALDDACRRMQIDSLTQLYNRGALDAALRRCVELSQCSGQALALVLLDLDHFKAVNDRYGHPVGDAVLLFVNDAAQVAHPVEALFERLRGLHLPMLEGSVLTC